jgi:hypothetical protein
MSTESEIRKLLKIRADLEKRVEDLQIEINDLNIAIAEIDKVIIKQGFQQTNTSLQVVQLAEDKNDEQKQLESVRTIDTMTEPQVDSSSIKSKDGTVLGKIQVNRDDIVFTPKQGLTFMLSTPPFQSFLLDRVLGNMRATDENRAAIGEISPEQILSYNVETEGEIIKSLIIRNAGGERRLREIQSSLRWSLDKMYDKVGDGLSHEQ